MTGRFQTNLTLFREATRGDEAALTPIAQRTIATCYHPFMGVSNVVEALEYEAINDYVLDNLSNNYCPILLLDQQPVGFAVCREITIDLIVIDYSYHGLGLGTQLLAHCEAEMFQAYPAIAAQCFEPDVPANRFFLKNGWTESLTYYDKKIDVKTIVFQKMWRGAKRQAASQ